MSRRRLALTALLVGVVALALVILTGGDAPYRVRMPLTSGSGLQDGSSVQIGGLDRGHVELHIEPGDHVVAELLLDHGAGPVGRDASASIQAQNFLGRKRVALDPGTPSRSSAPSGWTLPADRVGVTTDLDQVLGVFDADTRTRAQIMLNELGTAVTGRRTDIRTLLAAFPGGLEDAGGTLRALKTDSATMHRLLEQSDRIVGSFAKQRRSISRLVDRAGQTAKTVSARRVELRAALARAPHTLRSLQAFLAELRTSTTDLGPAARQLRVAAPTATAALAQVDGFRKAADPALDQATAVAPDLVKLAARATPVVRRATPTVRDLASLGTSLQPVSKTLDHSADNVIAILENWSRAIQFRDGLSHVFRGEASVTPNLILSAVDRLTTTPKRSSSKRSARVATPPNKAIPAAQLPAAVAQAVDRIPKGHAAQEALKKVIAALPKGVTPAQLPQAIGKAIGQITGDQGDRPRQDAESHVLDYLLGNG